MNYVYLPKKLKHQKEFDKEEEVNITSKSRSNNNTMTMFSKSLMSFILCNEIVNFGRFYNWYKWLAFIFMAQEFSNGSELPFLLPKNPRTLFTKWLIFAASAQKALTPS